MRDFPRTVEAITPQWLTGALRGCGALDGCAVTSFECAPLGAGTGFMSAMGRLSLAYDGPAPGAPRSLIAKLAPLHPGARQIDLAFHFYEKETGFYRLVAPSSPIRTPRAYHVSFEPETNDFILLLEDLAPARLGDQVEGLCAEDTALAVTAAGRLHARWWNCPELDGFDWLLPINSPQMRSLQPIYQQCWPAVVDFLGDKMPAEMKRTGERLATRIEAMLDLVAERPRTVMHGDFRADNMFFQVGETAEPFAVADWQVMLNGSSAFDMAYLLTGSLDVGLRRRCETDLLDLHHRTLVENGVSDYSRGEAGDDYRLCAMLGWCWPVVAIGSLDMTNDRGVAMFNAWTERSMTAVTDLDGAGLIPN